MMCNYKCPFAERRPVAGFILCKRMQTDGVNYNDRNNAFQIICPHQKQCQVTGQMENDDGARDCQLAKRPSAVETVVVKEAEPKQAAPAPKSVSQKKKNTQKA